MKKNIYKYIIKIGTYYGYAADFDSLYVESYENAVEWIQSHYPKSIEIDKDKFKDEVTDTYIDIETVN